MWKASLALIVVAALAASAQPVFASPSGAKSAKLTVSVRVVASCGVHVGSSGVVDVRCTRGAADRVLVSESTPRLVALERDGSRMVSAQVQTDEPAGAAAPERVVTLQF